MKLTLKRIEQVPKATIGLLFVDGKFQCFTLEDKVQWPKVPGETAIPTGTYEVKIGWSPRFKRDMPRLQNVPDYEGVLIHYGNTDKDTEGCILVGQVHEAGHDFIGQSRIAFNDLFKKLCDAESDGISIEIVNAFKE